MTRLTLQVFLGTMSSNTYSTGTGALEAPCAFTQEFHSDLPTYETKTNRLSWRLSPVGLYRVRYAGVGYGWATNGMDLAKDPFAYGHIFRDRKFVPRGRRILG